MRTPPLTPLAAATLRVPVPERALVIGCGNGDAALYMAREFPAARIRGIDRSDSMVREASARVGLDPEGRVAFKVGRGASLPYPDDLFDLVALLEGRAAAAEITRVLRPGGHAILVYPQRSSTLTRLRAGLLHRGLARRGIAPVAAESAGDGNFFVGRLLGGD